jgi:hypothetical protein
LGLHLNVIFNSIGRRLDIVIEELIGGVSVRIERNSIRRRLYKDASTPVRLFWYCAYSESAISALPDRLEIDPYLGG